MRPTDSSHVDALLATAGKHVAGLPGARGLIARLRDASTPSEFTGILGDVELGVADPARRLILDAAGDPARFEASHALFIRSAEQQLIERFSPSA